VKIEERECVAGALGIVFLRVRRARSLPVGVVVPVERLVVGTGKLYCRG